LHIGICLAFFEFILEKDYYVFNKKIILFLKNFINLLIFKNKLIF